jgi:hypothetical protein
VGIVNLQEQQYLSTYNDDPGGTAWSAWINFAAIMLGLVAVFQGIAGLTAIFKDEVFVAKRGLTVSIDYTAWGWIHLGISALLIIAAVSLMSGSMYGRIIGVFAAMVSAIGNLVFLTASPVWSVLMITIDVFVIYAIVVHGREMKAE